MAFIDVFAIFILVVLAATGVVILIAIGMAPGHIARKRGHPWAQAVSVSGWVTLIFGFVFWPLSLVWAYVDIPRRAESETQEPSP